MNRVSRVKIESLESRRLLSFSPLDPSFGNGGIIQAPRDDGLDSFDALAITVLPNGNTVVAGTSPEFYYDYRHHLEHDDVGTFEELDPSGHIISTIGAGEYTHLILLANGNI